MSDLFILYCVSAAQLLDYSVEALVLQDCAHAGDWILAVSGFGLGCIKKNVRLCFTGLHQVRLLTLVH